MQKDQTPEYLKELRGILKAEVDKRVLSKDEYAFIMNNHPRIVTFYALPKVHKSQEKPPGHPIASGNRSLIEGASQYIGFIMCPFVQELSSYIEDTWDFVSKLVDVVLDEGI